MSTTREDLKRWFEAAEKNGATHLIVVCDTFDHSDYPVFVSKVESAAEKVRYYNTSSMQRVHEVYKIALGWKAQEEGRAWNV